jgi:hypothetical protein
MRSGLLGGLHIHRTDGILNALATTFGAFLFVSVVLADRLEHFEAISTFFALEFIARHGHTSSSPNTHMMARP